MLLVVSWARGSFLTKMGSGCLVGRAFPCSDQAEQGSELELLMCQVCGLERGTEEALMVSCSPAHYMTMLSGDTRWKEACKFVKTEKSRIWFVIPLTVLCQGELSCLRKS